MPDFKTKDELRFARRYIAEQSKKYPAHCVEVPREGWMPSMRSVSRVIRVFRSREFLVQVHEEPDDVIRLSINRSALESDGNWKEGISWDELQRIKNECGYADRMAIEIFPPQAEVVNVANIRHLWVLPTPLPFMWRVSSGSSCLAI